MGAIGAEVQRVWALGHNSGSYENFEIRVDCGRSHGFCVAGRVRQVDG